jgi:hypothetical protein
MWREILNPCTQYRRLVQSAAVLLCLISGWGCGSSSTGSDGTHAGDYRQFLAVNHVESYIHVEPKTKISYPLVRGTLSNLGDESLAVVEFNVKFKNIVNEVIYEEKAYPVFLSEYSSASPQPPLMPGQTMKFALKFPSCPPQWKPGQVDIEITKVVIQKHPS